MRFKFFSMMFVLIMVSGAALAADLDSPGAPTDSGSAMFTIEDIYNRLNDGTEGTKRSGPFAGPTSGPSSAGHTLDDVMDKSPQKDDTNGATAADVADAKEFWGLTDGQWGPQTGTAAVAPSRFTDNGNETVTDTLTTLMWTKNANMTNKTWAEARSYCEDLSHAGYDDWRLPNINELSSLIDLSKSDPALPGGHPFSDVQSSYWSSTAYSVRTSYAWFVYLGSGSVSNDNKTSTDYVLPVRGGQ